MSKKKRFWYLKVQTNLVENLKFLKLSLELRGVLLMLWCVARENNGWLPPIKDLAIKLRISEKKLWQFVCTLQENQWLDEHIERHSDATVTSLRCHDWDEWQSDVTPSALRMRRHRGRHSDGHSDGNSNSNSNSNSSESEKKEDTTANAVVPASTYFFESGVIRLKKAQFQKWEEAFPHVSLLAELTALTEWAGKQEKWFFAVFGALRKRNTENMIKIRAAEAKAKTEIDDGLWRPGVL